MRQDGRGTRTWGPERVVRVVQALERLYGKRDHRHRLPPLDELVCCILTQNSTDAVAFPTFYRLREKYPEWERLAGLSPARLAKEIRVVGLGEQKARNIIGALREIKRRFGDYTLVPLQKMSTEEAEKWLRSLPGVGPKTAGVVLMFAFGRDALPVDTHVFRVSWRLGMVEKRTGAGRAHNVLKALVPRGWRYRFHVALIQHGRTICRARRPLCSECPVSAECLYYAQALTKTP